MAPTPAFRTRPPAASGPLVGRAAELARILSATERLITIKGPGGMGKTRLAIEALPKLGGNWFWCDLTDARTEDDVWRALSEAVGEENDPKALPPNAWIVLDNFESVAETAKPIVAALLRDHRLLVSSREVLGIPGERVIELPPLGKDGSAEGVTLFLQHAERQDPPLELTPKNEGAIRALVEAVDGIPLAIELAARRASVLGVEEVLARLRDGIQILSRPGPDRHASLARTIDETFLALSDAEQSAFLDAAVFRGGFTFEAAMTILEGPSTPDVTNLVQSLRDKSLLWLDEPGGRFHMHQVIRDFATERAVDRDTAARHATFFIAWIERVRTPAGIIPNREQRERVLADLGNLRAAAEHALARGDREGCARVLAGVAPTLRLYGDARWWADLKAAIQGATLPPDLDARIELVETLMLSLRGRRDEAEVRAAKLADSAANPDARLAAAILCVQQRIERGGIDPRAPFLHPPPTEGAHPLLAAEWALVSVQSRDPSAAETLAALERATAEAEKLGDATLLAAAARVKASLDLARGDVRSARASLEREHRIAEEAELRPVLAQNALRLGCCDQLEGDLEAASERFDDAIARMSALELRGRLPRAKTLLGLLSIERGDPAGARTLFADAEKIAAELRLDRSFVALGLALADHLAGVGPMPALPDALPRAGAGGNWASPMADLDRALRCTVHRTFANGPPPKIETDATATWFSTGEKRERVDLSDRPSLRHVLRALLDARGAAVESALLIAAGWPGERIREDAARNRLRVTIATLRKLGLEAIETEGTTYRLRAVILRR